MMANDPIGQKQEIVARIGLADQISLGIPAPPNPRDRVNSLRILEIFESVESNPRDRGIV